MIEPSLSSLKPNSRLEILNPVTRNDSRTHNQECTRSKPGSASREDSQLARISASSPRFLEAGAPWSFPCPLCLQRRGRAFLRRSSSTQGQVAPVSRWTRSGVKWKIKLSSKGFITKKVKKIISVHRFVPDYETTLRTW